MKKGLIIIITIITLIYVNGGQNYTELNDLAIIKSIGITYENNEYTLYAEIIDEINKDNLKETKIINASNKEIKKLFDDIKLLVNKEIYLSHIDLLIISETLKDDNYQEIINYFLENKEIRNDFICVFSNEIEEVLKKSKHDEIEEIITTNKDSKNVINITFEEVIKDFLDTKSFKASYITYDKEIRFTNNILYKNNNIERINNANKKN